MADARNRILATVGVLSLTFLLLPAISSRAAQNGGQDRVVVPFDGKSLNGWTFKGPKERSKWRVGIAKMDPQNPRQLIISPPGDGPGEMVNGELHGVDVYSLEKFGDCTVNLEFMVPKGSNSGVYVMGEYEVQILDSYGKTQVGPGDVGGLYGVAAPRVNAARPPGQWQKLIIEFRAPRFENGKKIANARFVKMELNGRVIHENVEMKSKTPAGVTGKEVPAGPLMFQGTHGLVAYRNIKIFLPADK